MFNLISPIETDPSVRAGSPWIQPLACPFRGLAIRNVLNAFQHSGGIAEAVGFGSGFVEHAHVEVVEGDVLAEVEVLAGIELSTGISGKDDGQVLVGVTVGIGQATSPDNHGVVQKAFAINVLGRFHLLKEVSELLVVEGINLDDLVDFPLIIAVMGETVVTFVHAHLGEVAVAAIVRQEERDTGPRSPSSLAHSFQIRTPFSCR